MLSVDEIAERASRPLKFLRRGRKTGRHDALWSTIAWSWELLDEADRHALTQCTVFAGAFPVQAAEQVVEVDGEVLDALDHLRAQSLLRAVHTSRGPRLRLYVAVRAFAIEHGPADARPAAARRYQRILAAAWRELADLPEDARAERIHALGDRVEDLMAQAREATEPEIAADVALLAAKAAERHGPLAAAAAVLGELDPDALGAGRAAEILYLRGRLLGFEGRLEEALAVLERAADRADAAADARGLGRSLCWKGRLLAWSGHREEGRASLQQALELHRRAGDRAYEAIALDGMGLALPQGDPDAIAYLERALAIHREVGARRFEASTATNLGRQYAWSDPERERSWYRLALDRFVALRDVRGEALVRGNLGVSHREDGEFERARAELSRSHELYRSAGMAHLACVALGQLANMEVLRGEWEAAFAGFEEALAFDREFGGGALQARLQLSLGRVEAFLGRRAAARARFRSAVELHAAAGHADWVAEAREELGRLALEEGDLTTALEELRLAVPDLLPGGTRAVGLARLAEAEARSGDLDACDAALARAVTEMGGRPEARRARVWWASVLCRQAWRAEGAERAALVQQLDASDLFEGHAVAVALVRERLGV